MKTFRPWDPEQKLSYDRMTEKEKRLKKEIREWFAESDRIDAEEDRRDGAT